MAKPLCELKKTLKQDFGTFVSLIENPTHVCRKCGRSANSKKVLCKPVKLKSGAESHV